jgi:hypothetical protein
MIVVNNYTINYLYLLVELGSSQNHYSTLNIQPDLWRIQLALPIDMNTFLMASLKSLMVISLSRSLLIVVISFKFLSGFKAASEHNDLRSAPEKPLVSLTIESTSLSFRDNLTPAFSFSIMFLRY